MSIPIILARLIVVPAHLLNALQPVVSLGLRAYVSWQFLKSGWLKITSWENTLFLFREEYHVPVLPPELAAVVGTAGELIFPVLLLAGLTGRLAAAGLSAVNIMAVVAYAHILLSEGFEAALGQHTLWGLMLVVVMVYGPGRLSLDNFLTQRRKEAGNMPMTPAATC